MILEDIKDTIFTSWLARVSDLEFGSEASFMSVAPGLLVDFLDIVQQGHQSYQSPASNFRRRREARMPFGAIVSAAPAERPRCKKLPEFVGVSGSGGGSWMFPAEADKQANNCAGKVCRMELENWVQTSHSKPGSHPIQGKRVDRWSWSLRRSQRNSWNRSL